MKLTKLLFNAAICVILVFVAYGQTAIAHNSSQQGIIAQSYMQAGHNGSTPNYMYVVGGEQVGWAILENQHLNGVTSSYAFDSGVNNTFVYTGYNYHIGRFHYYEYGDYCSDCHTYCNTHMVKQSCSGPPCNDPYVVPPVNE